ncbi:hypothetical protein LCH33_003829 [Pseudomonas amygdali]|uniref:hypothetical protein n=1 Tax=Pseudomonas amygdali TaxID=47877 RepID=UPI001CD881DD|nr:hypothetical protein [Pseudomonas amygdali]UBT80406.1 hypothetical protein LCH33_003829 [Pseudomonas amygdali]
MNPDDIAAIQRIVHDAMQNAEFINKVWIAGAAVIVSVFAALVASITQMLVARGQRKTQLRLADQQALQQKQALSEQLSMQELASRRIANANVSAKRQIWIDELRKDIARYLSLWQEISFRWDAIVSEPRTEEISDQALNAFKKPIAEMRMEALELQLRIELRLNMTESDHQELKALMEKLETSTILFPRTASSLPPADIQKVFGAIRQELIVKSQKILKEEWERVKKESYADPSASAFSKPLPAVVA